MYYYLSSIVLYLYFIYRNLLFANDPEDWWEFKNMLLSLIHKNQLLTKVQMFHYWINKENHLNLRVDGTPTLTSK